MTNKLSPGTVQIDDFTQDVLQKPLYPPFAHHRNKCLKSTPKIDQKSIKYRSGDGTKKREQSAIIFQIFHRKCFKMGTEREGEKYLFASFSHTDTFWAPLSPHGAPGWLRGSVFQDFSSIRAEFWQFFWCFRSDLLARFHGIASKKCFLLSFRSHQN